MGELRVGVLIDEGEEKGLLGLVEKERGPRVFRWFFAEESGSLPGGSIAVRETERGREGELEKGGEGVRRREEKGEEGERPRPLSLRVPTENAAGVKNERV